MDTALSSERRRARYELDRRGCDCLHAWTLRACSGRASPPYSVTLAMRGCKYRRNETNLAWQRSNTDVSQVCSNRCVLDIAAHLGYSDHCMLTLLRGNLQGAGSAGWGSDTCCTVTIVFCSGLHKSSFRLLSELMCFTTIPPCCNQ